MSATKAMQKWLKTAANADIARRLESLRSDHAVEKNPMVRSSLAERIRMAERILADEQRWKTAVDMHHECFGMHNVG